MRAATKPDGGAGLRAKLKGFTKDELIYIIGRLCWLDCGKDWNLQRAINELEYKREKKRLNEADQLRKVADEKAEEYNRLVEPYKGKSWLDIPDSVLKKMQEALKAYDAANEKWMKLMGIKPDGRNHDT
ncbi:MAG: hypothetical protein IJ673_12710 [Treponema sp.]|nr:hypothetical protein [Treponema sp.]